MYVFRITFELLKYHLLEVQCMGLCSSLLFSVPAIVGWNFPPSSFSGRIRLPATSFPLVLASCGTHIIN